MAYQTGSSASPTALKSTLETFCTTNGWTLSGGGVLSKGASNVRLVATDAEELTIEGANNAAFSVGVCSQYSTINIASTLWPVTYRMFSLGTPDFIACVLQYSVSRVQMIWFGEITKYGTWTGGNWFGASKGEATATTDNFKVTPLLAGPDRSAGAPFWETENRDTIGGGYFAVRPSFLHAEIDGYVWPGAGANDPWPSFPKLADPIHSRTPNDWNQQTVLTPMWLWMPRADTFYTPLGHIAHMRSVRVDNYDMAEIITLGADKWMLFPWHKKDSGERDGPPGVEEGHSGTFGVAISYDGP